MRIVHHAVMLSLVFFAAPSQGESSSDVPTVPRPAGPRLPFLFEANRGQTAADVKFLVRGAGAQLFLTASEAVLVSREGPEVRMQWLGANANAVAEGVDRSKARIHDYLGNDPARWRPSVPAYSRVRYRDLYPFTDLLFYGSDGHLEYDFLIRPGGDPEAIELSFEGVEAIRIESSGDALLDTGHAAEVRLRKPVAYQHHGGSLSRVEACFQATGNHLRFQVDGYDPRQTLVIDPVIVYSTYLGGSGIEQAFDVAVDAQGQAHAVGITNSPNFPTKNAHQPAYSEPAFPWHDVVIAKFDATGSQLIYATYLGGTGHDIGQAVALDRRGRAWVGGKTLAPNFPVLAAPQPAYAGGWAFGDGFIARLDRNGVLEFSTYLGGTNDDSVNALACEKESVYAAGFTYSPQFPGQLPYKPPPSPSVDAFVTSLNAGTGLVGWTRRLSGNGGSEAEGISAGADGIYVAGSTTASDFPIVNATQGVLGGSSDAFLTKLDRQGKIVLSTYLGGSEADYAYDVTNRAGRAYITGMTFSTNFPVLNAIQSSSAGLPDAFATVVDTWKQPSIAHSTYLGGSDVDLGTGIALDSAGNITVVGTTRSPDFPAKNPIKSTRARYDDAFITKIHRSGSTYSFSTLFGGTNYNLGASLAIDGHDNLYVAGSTDFNFPTVNPFQASSGGGLDAFVTKISDAAPPGPSPAPPELSRCLFNRDYSRVFCVDSRDWSIIPCRGADPSTCQWPRAPLCSIVDCPPCLVGRTCPGGSTFELLVDVPNHLDIRLLNDEGPIEPRSTRLENPVQEGDVRFSRVIRFSVQPPASYFFVEVTPSAGTESDRTYPVQVMLRRSPGVAPEDPTKR